MSSVVPRAGGALLFGLLLSLLGARGATVVVTNAADSGNGTLRQALTFANTNEGVDTITFSIPGGGVRTISPASALPAITDSVVIDGTTQPGFAGKPLIELNGSSAGQNAGLRLGAGNSMVRGLILNRFEVDGIRIEGPGTNWIQGNFIGTDAAGSAARPNLEQGIYVNNSFGNVIGGRLAGEGNLISGNRGAGVYIQNAGANVLEGNFIGTTYAGTGVLGNGNGTTNHGVVINNSAGNRVGGAGGGARNLISGNRGTGVYLLGSRSSGNLVQGNFIGTDAAGTTGLGNLADGVTVAGVGGNLVGGLSSGEGNLISGNGTAGVNFLSSSANNAVQGNFIGTDVSGTLALGNTLSGVALAGAGSNLVGGVTAEARNVISGNKQSGVVITNTVRAAVQGNYLGIDVSGTKALANRFNGLTILNGHYTRVGGASAEARNVISGNDFYGVQLTAGARTNFIEGNYIGLNHTGTAAVSNRVAGLRIESAGNVIGNNVISGNGTNGVFLVDAGASNNVVRGNHIGTDPAGAAALPNGGAGIGISDAPGNLIGGSGADDGNLISGNKNSGVYAIGRGATGNRIQGNKIGTDVSGSRDLGNAWEGIYLERAGTNRLGGNAPGEGNVISGNDGRGIWLTNAWGNLAEGNLIGLAANGAGNLGNAWHAVECDTGATNNVIGGGPGAGNRIAFARGSFAGVRIRPGASNTAILGNAIFSNAALGIDLGAAGVLANDNCDGDAGANAHQNYPVLSQAVSGNGTGIRGTLNSAAGKTFLLQFFASPACDALGNGESEVFLGETLVTTSPSCTVEFVADLPAEVPVGFVITATATDDASNTSELSACVTVTAVPALSFENSGVGALRLSWPATATGFVLKRAVSLAPPIEWFTVAQEPDNEDGWFSVTLPSREANEFFLLSFE